MLGKVLTTAIAKAHRCGQLEFTLQLNDQIALVKQYAIPYVEITNVETANQAMVVHIGYSAGTSMPGDFLHIITAKALKPDSGFFAISVGFEAVELKMLTADESVGVYKVLCPTSLQQCHTPFTVEAHEGGHRSKPHEVTSVQSLALVDNTGVSGAARTMLFEASTCTLPLPCYVMLCCVLPGKYACLSCGTVSALQQKIVL